VLWLLYVLIATVLFFRVTAVQQTNDSPSYLRAASAPLSSHTLWLGDKPPLVPLICKTLSNNLGAIVKFQFVFSVFAWSCLAYTLAAFVNRTLTRSALFAGILILSLGSDVSMWTHTIMSESVDHSCLALLLASWLLLMNRPSARRCIVVALLSGIWALTRDSNATVLIMVSITTGAALTLPRFRGRRKWYACAAIASLAFGLAGMQCDNLSGRWQFPFFNVLSQRVLPYPDRVTFFKGHGMPTPPALMDLKGGWAYTNGFAYWLDSTLDGFRKWANPKARRTYMLFVLTHPGFAFKPLASDLPEALFPPLRHYFWPGPLPAPSQDRINAWMRARIGYVLTIFWALAIGAVLAARTSGGFRSPLVLAYMIVWIGLLEYLVIWLADPMDLGRHYLSMTIALRISALLLAATIVDRLASPAPAAFPTNENVLLVVGPPTTLN
jgi:hypothetical protein